MDGPSLETLLLQELRAHSAYGDLGDEVFHWRTRAGLEVDFVLYGERGLLAFEVKRAPALGEADYEGLRAFSADYPMAPCVMAYGGTRRFREGPIEAVPFGKLLDELPERLRAGA